MVLGIPMAERTQDPKTAEGDGKNSVDGKQGRVFEISTIQKIIGAIIIALLGTGYLALAITDECSSGFTSFFCIARLGVGGLLLYLGLLVLLGLLIDAIRKK